VLSKAGVEEVVSDGMRTRSRKKTGGALQQLSTSSGHSHTDPGALGSGASEADIALEFRDLLANALEARGVQFQRDGLEGERLPLSQSVKMAADADIAVEFHCNAFSNQIGRA